MSDAYIGEIRIVPYNFDPANWMRCDGQLLSISQNTALFSLIGTYYGGDGRSTFALPDLRDRMPLAASQGPGLSYYDLGQQEGAAAADLNISEIPGHTHTMQASAGMPAFNGANGHVLTKVSSATPPYHAAQNLAYAAPGMLQPNGGSQPHNNRQPYLGLTFVICAQGIFPSRA
jgi:microcystin-dependent protein